MSYQETLARIAQLKGANVPNSPTAETVGTTSGSSDSALSAHLDSVVPLEMDLNGSAERPCQAELECLESAERPKGALPKPPEPPFGSLDSAPPEAFWERESQLERLYRDLSEEVSKDAPVGIGTWPPLGEIVDPAAHRLFEAGTSYVEARVDREELLRAARELRHSWWLAAALYRQAERETPAIEEPP